MCKNVILYLVVLLAVSCSNVQKTSVPVTILEATTSESKIIDDALPTVGILIFDGVIMNEVIAPLDVFSKHSKEDENLFNVVLIGKKDRVFTSEHGLNFKPDYTIENAPKLNVLVVPSSYAPDLQVADAILIGFIKKQYDTADYIASHCAGAWLIAASGIADGKEVVTYVTGHEALQKAYPKVKVADDEMAAVVRDGNLFSSNGNLVSYRASLDLLEEITTAEHRNYVAQELYLDRLVIN